MHNNKCDLILKAWPSLMKYVDAVRTKKVPNPGNASFDTIEAAQKDTVILSKLQFFMGISRTFTLYLTKYQTDAPVKQLYVFVCVLCVEMHQAVGWLDSSNLKLSLINEFKHSNY